MFVCIRCPNTSLTLWSTQTATRVSAEQQINYKIIVFFFFSGGASIAKGMSLYVDALSNKTMETTFRELYEIDSPYLSEYFDFFAMFIVIVFSGKQTESLTFLWNEF